MTITEAYNLALAKVEELKQKGIKVEITPCESDEETISEYSTPLNISHDLWIHVTFYPKDNSELQLVFKAGSDLIDLGIGFDSGGSVGYRDWELDWSFRLNTEEKETTKKMFDKVESLIVEIEDDEKAKLS